MNADQELHKAITDRIVKENTFFNLLKEAIKDAVEKFDLCDTSTSPEVEESVHLSIDGLQKAIDKLKDEATMNKEAADSIKVWFSDLSNRNNLVKDSTLATSSTPTRSFADRAKGWFGFSAPAAPAPRPIVASPVPQRSMVDRFLGRRPDDLLWNAAANNPNKINGPEFELTPQPYVDGRVNSFGGKRKTRKYRRRV